MSRVLAALCRDQWYEGAAADTRMETIMDGRRVHAPLSVMFGGFQQYITDATLAACATEPQLVVELGSGWGRNLFSIWLSGGPADATYVGAEYTGAGRRAAARIAALEPALRFESIPFDYHAPDLSALPRVDRAVVITVHSVEQIPHVRQEVIESIRGLAGDVECLHFEPVGWQAGDAERTGTSQEAAEAHDYNRNLLSLLREAEAREEIEIVAIDPEVVGAGTVRNATTLAHWRATRA
jgi:hypothetical protein